ncbi:hypothetical protein [Actinoplanes regularis]|uniref:Uncharacterized protein n=1 Tax=Actinoplanes regularis TaxID=52697 RepID=A0A239ER66_9ACTN|nr:hypothetical protein [Actinoplanes regularis]GIE89825.1 hypothetical protein Are01nite_63050 [Actinoplanes regularis]GLW31919.1 hypothetical protein Areg01_48580 [Actinoplanes regularis]SNS47146.1 hypothetical protein SAMN06264365_11668 [Actinoplanes regularis]
MAEISATASSPDSQAAWSRLQNHRRQLAADLIPAQANPQTIAADRAAVAVAEAELIRLEGAQTVTAGKIATIVVQAESAAIVTTHAWSDLPYGSSLDVTV